MTYEILICTSILQVINANSAINLKKVRKNTKRLVLIAHPLLEEPTIRKINYISSKIGFDEIIDITKKIRLFEKQINEINSNNSKLQPIKKLTEINRKQLEYERYFQRKYQHLINNNNVYIRSNYKFIDSFLCKVLKPKKIFQIDDGLVDIAQKFWFLKDFNYHTLKLFVKNSIFTKLYYLLILLITGNLYSDLYKIIFFKNKNIVEKFSIKKEVGFKNIEKQFLSTIKKLSKKNIREEVLIIGTTIDKNYKYNVKQETNIYNKLISLIKRKYSIQNNQILYKPHPRISIKDWKYKKKYLNCSICKFDNNEIAESIALNKKIKYVYSFGSTSLIYAKKIFKKDATLVYFKSKDRHPSSNEMYLSIAKKEKLKIIYL